ncbi:hypothetical protein ACFE04_026110 [Oxalis oulophora]
METVSSGVTHGGGGGGGDGAEFSGTLLTERKGEMETVSGGVTHGGGGGDGAEFSASGIITSILPFTPIPIRSDIMEGIVGVIAIISAFGSMTHMLSLSFGE